MIAVPYDIAMDEQNPLDLILQDLKDRKWTAMADGDDCLNFEAKGKCATYHGTVEWQDEFKAVLFSLSINLRLPENTKARAGEMMTHINNNIWLGHFDLTTEGVFPTFRHSFLMRHLPPHIAAEQVFDVIEIAMAECDRFYQTFEMIAENNINTENSFSAAVLETLGEA
jgi:hypothetical protein